MLHVTLCDGTEKELAFYEDLAKTTFSDNGIPAEVRSFRTADQLRFALGDAKADPTDIVLIDMDISDENGIELGRSLRDDGYSGAIIYLARSLDFTLPAFDVRAFNYVLKGHGPQADDRLRRVLVQAAQSMSRRRRECLLLNGIDSRVYVPIEDISYFEVRSHIISVHYTSATGPKSFEFVSTLGKVENMLLDHGFVRVHRSFLVSSDAIGAFAYDGLTLTDGTQIPVGRTYTADLRRLMDAKATAEKHH